MNDSKSHVCNSFFENIISGVQLFLYFCPQVPGAMIRVFLFQSFYNKVSKLTNTSEKDHSFYNTV